MRAWAFAWDGGNAMDEMLTVLDEHPLIAVAIGAAFMGVATTMVLALLVAGRQAAPFRRMTEERPFPLPLTPTERLALDQRSAK